MEKFRLALSYLERAESELKNWERIRSERSLDRTNYDQVRARYASHQREASKLVAALRREADRQLTPAEAELRRRQRSQRKLVEAATAGTLDPRKANEQNRVLTAEIAASNAIVDELRAIVGAETTAAIGGAVSLPLEEYGKRFETVDLRPPRRAMSPTEKNIAVGVVMLALVLATVVGLAMLRSEVRAEFSVSDRELRTGFVSVLCTNVGNRPIVFHVPWPNGQSRAPEGTKLANRGFGVLLYIRETGSTEFRLLEGAEGAWKFRGVQIEESTPIEVRPKSSIPVNLDLNVLREKGLEVEAVRFEFSRHGGAIVMREELSVLL